MNVNFGWGGQVYEVVCFWRLLLVNLPLQDNVNVNLGWGVCFWRLLLVNLPLLDNVNVNLGWGGQVYEIVCFWR